MEAIQTDARRMGSGIMLLEIGPRMYVAPQRVTSTAAGWDQYIVQQLVCLVTRITSVDLRSREIALHTISLYVTGMCLHKIKSDRDH